MISRLLGLHKHPSTKNLEEYKGLKKTKSFFKDFLAQSKVVVLKQQDIIDLEAESFNPLRERGLSKGYVKDSALGEAYLHMAQDIASLNTMLHMMNKSCAERVMIPVTEMAESQFDELLEKKRDELNHLKDAVDKGMSMGAKAMAKKSVTPEEIERVQEIGRASAEHLGALKERERKYISELAAAQLKADDVMLKALCDYYDMLKAYHRSCRDLLHDRMPALDVKVESLGGVGAGADQKVPRALPPPPPDAANVTEQETPSDSNSDSDCEADERACTQAETEPTTDASASESQPKPAPPRPAPEKRQYTFGDTGVC